jgi:hypothetical protein
MKRYPANPAPVSHRAVEVAGTQSPTVTDSGYVVEIKPSARRRCRAVGEWVNDRGPIRRFDSKPLARAWARDVSSPGTTVWIQDASPTDDRDADGYLVSGTRRGNPSSRGRDETQSELVRF